MTTLDHSRTAAPATPHLDRAGFLLLIAGGAAFFASGPLHPTGSDAGDKTEQLHSMLVDSAWYPAHLVALLGFACVAAGLLALAAGPGDPRPPRQAAADQRGGCRRRRRSVP